MRDESRPTASVGGMRFVLTLLACLMATAAIAVWTVRYVTVELPAQVLSRATDHAAETARKLAADIAEAVQVRPRVTVGTRTIFEQETQVSEFVILERTVTERHRSDESWLHSTKTFEVEGDFVVRAGFDLEQPFSIALDETASELRVRLPQAEVLGAELTDLRILRDEDGLWNKLTAGDREDAVRALRRQALAKARASGLPDRARRAAEEKLEKLLGGPGRSVSFEAP